ncbi:MAG: FkbM family methyltransferase [Bacteroidia bacterium]
MIKLLKHIVKSVIVPGYSHAYREEQKKQKEVNRLKQLARYLPATTTIFTKEIRVTDAASFLFIYDEIFNKQIYKFKSVTDNPHIIDCGANIGLSIIYFKQLYPKASVIGFEPDGKTFDTLKYNMNQFGFSDIELKQKGVWDKETVLNFFSEGADGGRVALTSDKENIHEIKTERLRDYLNTHVDFLKIDIEGAETRVLIDCADNLKNVDRIFVEYHSFTDREQDLQDLLKVLNDAGFRYNVQHVGVFSQTPFIKVETSLNIDNQLNIFAYR